MAVNNTLIGLDLDLQYLRVWVSRVRRKLGAKPGDPGRIKTFQGIGYLLDIDGGKHEEPESDGAGARPSATSAQASQKSARTSPS